MQHAPIYREPRTRIPRRAGTHSRLVSLVIGVAALAFMAGQLMAWRQLDATGHILTANPASSFFYLITALHGLHVLGGMAALSRSIARAWRGKDLGRLRLGLDLCSMYWDFLLLMWLVLFGLLLLS